MQLYDELKQFKICTEELIKSLNDEQYEKLADILDKREDIIKNIDSIQYDKSDFIKAAEELNISALDKKAHELLTQKRDVVKLEIQNLFTNKRANKIYNHKLYNSAKIFSKKI